MSSPTISPLSSLSTASTSTIPEHSPTGSDSPKVLIPQSSHVPSRPPLSKKVASVGTMVTMEPGFEVDWDDDEDVQNPVNWPTWYKGVVLLCLSWSTWVVVLYSTSYTTGLKQMQADFHVGSEVLVTLGLTIYLVGLALGSLILAPVSEIYGRKPVYMVSMLLFMLLVIPCAKATSLAAVLTVRFFGAVAASAMIANAPGSISDIVTDEYRALAFSIWSVGPLNGPVFGSVIGGFVTQYLGWRWTNWLIMIFSGVAWIMVCCLKETYSPAILTRKAALQRKRTNDPRWWSRYDQREPFWELLRINLARPLVMAVREPICIFWNLYIATIYATLYLCFVAYPIVFQDIRGWTGGVSGLAFLGIGVGTMSTILLEPLIRRMINAHAHDPDTGRAPPEAMVSAVCIGAVLVPIGELWFAWTSAPPVHWIWPILAGLPFGAGNTAIFIYGTNYLAGAYGIYSASAMAGNAIMRSLLGGTLPVAGSAIYARLGPHWAGTMLGLVQVLLIPIPLVFYRYGGAIRRRSALIARMQGEKARLEGRRARGREKAGDEEQAGLAARPGILGRENLDREAEKAREGGLFEKDCGGGLARERSKGI